MIAQLPKTTFDDEVQERAQSALKVWSDKVSACPLLDGVMTAVVSMAATTAKAINHTLGRVPVGYLLVYQSAAGTVHQTASSKTSITMEASAAMTIKLWVF
jgi:hypothetical protein